MPLDSPGKLQIVTSPTRQRDSKFPGEPRRQPCGPRRGRTILPPLALRSHEQGRRDPEDDDEKGQRAQSRGERRTHAQYAVDNNEGNEDAW